MSQIPINAVHSGSQSPGAGYPLSLPSSVGVASVVMIILRWDAMATGVSVSSNIDGALSQIGTDVVQSSATILQRFYVKNSAGGTCTLTINGAGGNFHATAFEIPGCDTTAPLDVSAQATGSSTTASSGATSTRASAASVGIASAGIGGGVTFSNGSGFTLIDANGDVAEQASYQVFTLTGTDAGVTGLTPSTPWGAAMDVFKAAASAVAPTGTSLPQMAIPFRPTAGGFVLGTPPRQANTNAVAPIPPTPPQPPMPIMAIPMRLAHGRFTRGTPIVPSTVNPVVPKPSTGVGDNRRRRIVAYWLLHHPRG